CEGMEMANAPFPVEHFSMEQFNCPVCLDVLKEPVTTCCGHSFCKVCINGFWDQENRNGCYSCPQCRRTFAPRPDLYKNSMLAEMMEKLQALYPAQCYAGPGDVAGTYSTRRKEEACLNSSCETRLQPHLEVHVLKKHNLIEVKLPEKICSERDKPNEMDSTGRRCICSLCKLDKHKGHDAAALSAERPAKQLQQMVSTSEPKSRDDFLK
ncbi:E3 ubiquitin/ISG15 ligase TRIM25-like, partial [Clarias magur]